MRSILPILRALLPLGACVLGDATTTEDAAAASQIAASLDAYVAAITTQSAFSAIWTGLPKGIPQDIAFLAGLAPLVSSVETRLPTQVQSFINSVVSEEQKIEHSTVDPVQFSMQEASAAAALSSVEDYLISLATEAGYTSIETAVPTPLLDVLPLFVELAPALAAGEGSLPEDVQEFINSVISVEQKIEHTTVSTVVLHHVHLPFSSTTITGGTFMGGPTAKAAATGGPSTVSATATTVSTSTSAAAAVRCNPDNRDVSKLGIGLGAAAALFAL